MVNENDPIIINIYDFWILIFSLEYFYFNSYVKTYNKQWKKFNFNDNKYPKHKDV